MQVKCGHCGGENAVHPGQRMLFCSFCGSALVIERSDGPEHLILPHERNDRSAGDALRSYLLSKGRGTPEVTKVAFAFIPFLLVEEENGETGLAPASDETTVSMPYPPAGNYRFFDESIAAGERIVPIDGSHEGAEGAKIVKILHLPLYNVEYRCGRFEGTAAIVGGSWHVDLSGLPAEGQVELKSSNLLVLAALFTAFLFIGAAAPNWAMRFVYIFLSAAAGFVFFRIRDRMVSGS